MAQPLNIVFFSGCEGDTQRYRCIHSVEQLRMMGHNATWFWQSDHSIIYALDHADALILHRPATTHYLDTVLSYADGVPIFYETDDLIFDHSLLASIPLIQQSSEAQRQRWRNYVLGNMQTLERCHGAIVSTQPIANHLSGVGVQAWVHENVLSPELLHSSNQARSQKKRDRPLTIGYFSGSRSHNQDFAQIASVLLMCLETNPTMRLLIGGYLDLPPEFERISQQIERRKFLAWQQLPQMMVEADIIVAPLDTNNVFANARSALKYLEAGALGLPVIASPTPAFTQAIIHNETGILANSVDEWHHALVQLIENPAIRQRLGDASYTHIHQQYTFENAAPKLETTLRSMLERGFVSDRVIPTPTEQEVAVQQWQQDTALIPQSVYMLTGCDMANAANYRCRHRQQQLELHDIRSVVLDLYSDGMLLSNAITFEIAILHRVAFDERIKAYISLMQNCGRPVLFDTDDLIFRPEFIQHVDAIRNWPEADLAMYRDGVERYQQTLLACDGAIVSTEPLAQWVRELGKPAYVVRNALSWQQIEAGQPLAIAKQEQPAHVDVTIGYFSGTATHNKDFAQVAPALLHLLNQHPTLRLRIVGPLELDPMFDPYMARIEHRELVSLTALVYEVADVDIAIAPLEIDNPYCQAKSEVKYMEAGIVATPVVATPIEAFQTAIRHGDNGMLAKTTDEWIIVLNTLISDTSLRRSIGIAAYHDVLQRYTPRARSRSIVSLLAQLWRDKQSFRERASFNEVFLHSLDLYEQLDQRNQQTNTMLKRTAQLYEQMLDAKNRADHLRVQQETQIQELRHYVTQLEHHNERVANGRVMRMLNYISNLRQQLGKKS